MNIRSIEEIQGDINSTENAIQAGNVSDDQVAIWQSQLIDFKNELKAKLAEQQAETNLKAHIAQNGYILDTLTAGEYHPAELAATPADYTLLCIAVQKWALEQQEKATAQDGYIKILENREFTLQDEYNTLEGENISLDSENADLTKKLKNATDIIAELEAQIKKQTAIENNEIAPLTAEQQDEQWKAQNEKLNNRTKVTNIRNADPTGIDTRKSIVTIALTQENIETETLYLKGRYVEISEVEAEQLRADYANKKAEIEAQSFIPEIPPVTEPEANVDQVTEYSPSEEDVQAGQSVGVGQPSEDRELVEEESKVRYLTASIDLGEPLTTEERVEQVEREQAMMHEWVYELAERMNSLDGKGIKVA